MPLYLCGFLTLGGAFQNKLSIGAVVMGWGIAEVAVMINTVAICEFLAWIGAVHFKAEPFGLDAYCNDCFPRYKVVFL